MFNVKIRIFRAFYGSKIEKKYYRLMRCKPRNYDSIVTKIMVALGVLL